MDHGIHFCFSKLCLYSCLASIPATLMKTSCTGMEISCLVQETSPSLHNQKNPFLSSVQVFCISQEHHWLHLNDDFCLEEMPWLAPLAVFEFSAAKSLCAFLSGALQGKLSGRLHPGACQTRFKPRCRRRSPKQRQVLQAVLDEFGGDIWLGPPEHSEARVESSQRQHLGANPRCTKGCRMKPGSKQSPSRKATHWRKQ